MAIITLNNNSLSSVTALPAGVGGKVLQVVSTTKTDTFTSQSTSYTDITGMSASITPASTSNKILVLVNLNVGMNTDDRWHMYQLVRGSTAIAIGDASGSRTQASAGSVRMTATGSANFVDEKTITFLDSPSASSSTTYKLQGKCQSDSSPEFAVNRPGQFPDANYIALTASTITLMEVAGWL